MKLKRFVWENKAKKITWSERRINQKYWYEFLLILAKFLKTFPGFPNSQSPCPNMLCSYFFWNIPIILVWQNPTKTQIRLGYDKLFKGFLYNLFLHKVLRTAKNSQAGAIFNIFRTYSYINIYRVYQLNEARKKR